MRRLPLIYESIIRMNFPKGKLKVLDVGCGIGVAGEVFNKEKKHKFIGIDIFEPYLKKCRESGYYAKCLKKNLTQYKTDKSKYDLIILFQVIEHLKKNQSVELLKKLEKQCRGKIIISVPNGHCEQGEYDHNPYQAHHSQWDAQSFKKLGYKVYGQGLKFMFMNESYGHPGKEASLWQNIMFLCALILSPFLYFSPAYAAQVIAVKEIKNEKK